MPDDDLSWLRKSRDSDANLIEHWRSRMSAHVATFALSGGHVESIFPNVDVLLQATMVRFGEATSEGQLVIGVAIPWFEIIKQLERDPDFLFKVPWRKLEELIAGAYDRAGWKEVILTPRSGDGGIDVMASHPGGFGSIRIIDQVKKFKPGHVVTANDVRAMIGVLDGNRNVSKGFLTTTSRFAPGIYEDENLQRFMPNRLELREGPALRAWLLSLASNK
jgi:restriction system protein